jgi:signal transduction histidine kinase
MLAGALLLLMPALAVLQFRWVGQVSSAEKERMQRNVEIAASQFREAFDGELGRSLRDLSVSSATAREVAWDRYATRYEEWKSSTSHSGLVSNVYLIDADNGRLGARRWDVAARTFVRVEWPSILASSREYFEAELAEFTTGSGVGNRPRPSMPVDSGHTLLITPLRGGPIFLPRASGTGRATGTVPRTLITVFGFTVIELDLPYIQNEVLPALAERHFNHSNVDTYRVTVVDQNDPTRVVFKTDELATTDPAAADTTAPLFPSVLSGVRIQGGQGRETRPVAADRRNAAAAAAAASSAVSNDEIPSRWRLLVQHESGSLEAAVAGARKRNLALSFGVLLLLTVSIGLLTVTSRRAQQIARQQMEFVAGVSHELRTPVAVIKSAAENLSQGVVGNADRVKRYGKMIEGEARRLAEMVERVLQYAGIESGLGYGTRAALAPAEIIESAIDSALPLLGPDTVTVQRDISESLPAVMGDAAALRSAVQNLVANAVKYGGRDRWVGVKAEHVRERRAAQVRITVSDHGPGIPANELPHIFEPFYRGGEALAQQIHGNGLGLSLVKRIVVAHGGDITVVTKAGAGTSFTILLPAAEPDTSSSNVTSGVRAAVHP